MGYAHGLLMKQEMAGLIDNVWKYLEAEVVRGLLAGSPRQPSLIS